MRASKQPRTPAFRNRKTVETVEQQVGQSAMTKRILVVEDQADNMQILRDLLTSAGYELIEAKDGEEG
jgi:PleD family two-component response regulator